MNFINTSIHLLFSFICLFISFAGQVNAEEFLPISTEEVFNMTQSEGDWRKLELTESQTRSRVRHTLTNFLLGRTVDAYLDLGAGDDKAQKGSERLKLRLRRHRITLIFQKHFE